MSNANMTLWDSVRTPDPKATKSFSRSGGFKGTATNAVYLIQRATELWGPMGGKWGVEFVDERVFQGAPMIGGDGQVVGHEQLHVVRINLRHPDGVVPGFGQTMMVGKNKWGLFTDEEAPKKSLTDAVTKALSWLGFAADIHLGRWDDSKYVNDAQRLFEEKAAAEATKTTAEAAKDEANAAFEAEHLQTLRDAAMQGTQAMRDAYARIPACQGKTDMWVNHKQALLAAAAAADEAQA